AGIGIPQHGPLERAEAVRVLEPCRINGAVALDGDAPILHPLADLRGNDADRLRPAGVVADVDADGADRREVADAEARGPDEAALAEVLDAAPDLAEVHERGSTQPVAEQRETQLGAALEEGRATGRPGLERAGVARLVDPARVARPLVDLARGAARSAFGFRQQQVSGRVHRDDLGAEPALREASHARRAAGE